MFEVLGSLFDDEIVAEFKTQEEAESFAFDPIPIGKIGPVAGYSAAVKVMKERYPHIAAGRYAHSVDFWINEIKESQWQQ